MQINLFKTFHWAKKCYECNSALLKKIYNDSEREDFYLRHVSGEFVLKELSQLNPYKSTGLDEIPARFLKEGTPFLKIPVTFLINMPISDSCVPGDMKTARVKPLYKKNSNLDVGNYKPVSILCVVSKFLTKAIYIQLEAYLVKIILFIITNLVSEVHSLQILALFTCQII